MKKEESIKNIMRLLFEGRTARILVSAVTVLLCFLTIFEFVALRLELKVPVMEVLSGENGFWSEEYQREELALDHSAKNEILKDGNTQEIEPDTELVEKDSTELNEKNVNSKDENDSVVEFPYYIRINRQQNCITIYTLDELGEYTVPYKAMICSTGLYNATPCGIYQISTKYRWRELYGNVYGQYATRIHGGVLFHSVPYYKKSKNALCTEKYNKLGQQASMGCVRLTVEDAKWIAENCPTGTTVEIYDDENPGPLGKPEALKIDTDNPNKGWDPTDPDIENPWNQVLEDR